MRVLESNQLMRSRNNAPRYPLLLLQTAPSSRKNCSATSTGRLAMCQVQNQAIHRAMSPFAGNALRGIVVTVISLHRESAGSLATKNESTKSVRDVTRESSAVNAPITHSTARFMRLLAQSSLHTSKSRSHHFVNDLSTTDD